MGAAPTQPEKHDMPHYLIYDTETTGLPDWHTPSDDPSQPHIVQLAAVLIDETGEDVWDMNAIVRPEGWEIPPEATAVHGISQERAMDEGIAEQDAVTSLMGVCGLIPEVPMSAPEMRIAHNDSFDARIIRIAIKRYGMGEELMQTWKDFPRFCTMRKATGLCKIPPTERMMASGRRGFKSPSLAEAHRILLDRDIEGAHDAKADVIATKALFLHLRGIVK